jgi:DNA repair exonuclease SbcCD ATPase subunit
MSDKSEFFDVDEWNFVLNKILLHYDGGKFKFQEGKSSQEPKHRSAKKNCKIAIKEAVTKSSGKGFHQTAYNLLLEYAQLQDTGYQSQIIERLNKEKDELIKRLKKLDKQPNSVQNLAETLAMNLNDEFKKNYVCEREDVNKLNDRIKYLEETGRDKDDTIKTLKQEVKDVRETFSDKLSDKAVEIAHLELANQDKPNVKKLKEEMKELKDKHKEEIKQLKEQLKQKPKENMDDNKEKFLKDKLKKILSENKKISSENLELKNRIVELEVDAM